MQKPVTVKEWRKAVKAGKIDTSNRAVIARMGWVEWLCPDHALTKRSKSIAHILSQINNPHLLDDMTIILKNGYTLSGKKTLYDTFEFHDINTGTLQYAVKINSGYENMRYVVYSGRVWDGPLFQTDNDSELAKWFNRLTSRQPINSVTI